MRYHYNKGYTLLFAVLVATLVLSIGLYILSVSRKQFILSEAARDSMNAFYAADSGLSCALSLRDDIWTSVQNSLALSGSLPHFIVPQNTDLNAGAVVDTCNGVSPAIVPTTLLPAPYTDAAATNAATTTFFLPVIIDPIARLGANGYGGACVWVKIGYNYDGASPPNLVSTIVEVRGYNIGYKGDDNVPINGGPDKLTGTCANQGPRKVERALQYISN